MSTQTDSIESKDVSSREMFKGKKSLVVALPGAYTPTCTSKQLPGFEKLYDEFKKHGIDEIYCLSVNDAFVMYNWAKSLDVKNVKMLPDGNADLTRQMGMMVKKENLGFGMRSWRYACIINDGKVEAMFEEPGFNNFSDDDDPYELSTPENVMKYLNEYEELV